MNASVSEPGNRDVQRPLAPAPVQEVRETQEVLWEQMKVRTESSSENWKSLAPDQRISREGFKPLVSRSISSTSTETEAALKAADRYQEELKDESARAEDMLQHLDELEGHLHTLHASNDLSEELSILISYVRLEKAVIQGQDIGGFDHDPDRHGIPVLSATASVDITRSMPLAKPQRSSEDDSSPEDAKEEQGPEGEPVKVKPATDKK